MTEYESGSSSDSTSDSSSSSDSGSSSDSSSTGGIDFSPIVVFIAIMFLQSFLVQTLRQIAFRMQ